MAETTTMTVAIPAELKAKLDRLAKAMDRSPQALALEAMEEFARYETANLDNIEEADADFEAGRYFTHEQVMAELDQIIENERQANAGKPRKVANG